MSDLDNHLEKARDRLATAEFTILDGGGADQLRAHRRQTQATRFGRVDTYVTVTAADGTTSPDDLRSYSRRCFERDRDERSGPPRGLFGQLVSYPVLVVEKAAQPLRDFTATHAPRHWGAIEFPVVVELGNGLHYLRKTPIWGFAYFRRTREEVDELFAP